MAEIRVERKEGKGWLWVVLALLAIAVLAWWFFGSRNDSTAVGASDGTIVPAAVTADRGAVDGFLPWVADSDTMNAAATSDLSHEYMATGVRQLAGAIASIPGGDSLGGSDAAPHSHLGLEGEKA